MSPAKVILIFVAKFTIVYAILIIPQTNIGHAYAGFIRAQGQLLFGHFGKKGKVEFVRNEEEKNKWEFRTKMYLMNSNEATWSADKGLRCIGDDPECKMTKVYSSWYHDYLFVALLIALIIATPISMKRKLWALLWGFILIHIFIDFSFFIQLLFKFNSHDYLEVIQLGSFGKKIVEFIYPIVVINPGTGIFVALIIWLVVSFRKEDISNLMTKIKSYPSVN